MLTRLHIQDFALIEEVVIEFGEGLNVITGETGAGKSILMGALYSILGGQTSGDLVRSGSDRCLVEGIFELDDDPQTASRLLQLGVELEEGQLILRRELRANGRSRAFVNGLAAPLKTLRGIGDILVDLHGQHEHQSLLDARLHTGFLDAIGGLDDRARAVSRCWHDLRTAEQRLNQLRNEREHLATQEELRRYQLSEIRDLAPEPGEDARLQQELGLLENAETIKQTCAALFDMLYEADSSITGQLGRGRRELERLSRLDPALEDMAGSLDDLVYAVEDISSRLRDYAQRLDVQPERTEEVRERLAALRGLCRKHGGSLDAVLETATELEAQESRTDSLDQELQRAEVRFARSREAFSTACRSLSEGRAKAVRRLAKAVEKELRDLGMPQVEFSVDLQRRMDPEGPVEDNGTRWHADADGLERAEFHISPNVGEAPRPLARIASGGEISRVMLALKAVIAGRDTVSTLVFDEIDVGISGRVAAAVGRKLRALANSHQLIVITHLPQIASAAASHFSVRKREQDGRTVTEVHPLGETERAWEIAHLIAGDTVSEAALQHAREMLDVESGGTGS